MNSKRDFQSNRAALFDGIEEGGICSSSSYSCYEIDEHKNERCLDGLHERVNILKRGNAMDASRGMLSGTMDRFKMVFEPSKYQLVNKMRDQINNSFKHALFLDNSTATGTAKDSKPPSASNPKHHRIGILSFEVANAMSKTIRLHKSLSDTEISILDNEVLKSHGIRTLVSTDESHLLELVLAEKLDELNRIASLVSRLGKRCTEQPLVGFEHVYTDLLKGQIDIGKLGLAVKDMEKMIRKMERYVNSTASLYCELSVLNELEQGVKKFHMVQHHEDTHRALKQKIMWQQHDVRHLRDTSLWNQTYDKTVGLMARAVCTIYARIHAVFGDSAGLVSNTSPKEGHLSSEISTSGRIEQRRPALNIRGDSLGFPCGASPGRLFMDCLSVNISTSWDDNDEHLDSVSHMSQVGGRYGLTQFGPNSRVTMHADPSTVGGSALALHYANIIIIIEKFIRYSHLVGEEARDDLYQMLPMSLRLCLKKNLKSYVRNLAIYDAPLAHDWKLTLDNLLRWLAPMAHNMIRWQTERSFEQQHIVLKTNVLLLQTLYFADREKTEAEICELLVGLNYICRYEHQRNALLDSRSSADFDECVDWQLQH